MIKAVFFDLDDTLYDRERAVRAVIQDQYATFREGLARIPEPEYTRRLLELDDHGLGDKDAMYRTVAAEWSLDTVLAGQLLKHFWKCYEGMGGPTEGAVDTLRILRARGRKLGVISNGPTVRQQGKLAAMGMARLFDVVLISEAEGVRKPDPAIFLRACERCGVLPGEAVFVGDNPEADVAGAQATGMVAVWKRVPWVALAPPDVLAVNRLEEILPACLAP